MQRGISFLNIEPCLLSSILIGRGGGIRTPDPLLPKQMRYQAALRPDSFHFNPAGTGFTCSHPPETTLPQIVETVEYSQVHGQQASPWGGMEAVQGVIIAYGGHPNLRWQATYALLSALAFAGPAPPPFTIYTDAPEWFAHFGSWPRVELIDAPRIGALTGGSGDPYHLKLAAVRDTALRFPQTPVLLCDADAFFIAGYAPLLQRLQSGERVMHRREYAIATHPTGQMRKFRRALRAAGLQDTLSGLFMWNSGAIGLPAGSAQVVDEALAILARLAPHTKKKYLAEQFSMSLAMQTGATVAAAEDFVFHYWYQKADYTRAIQQRLETWQGWPIADQVDALRAQPLTLPCTRQKLHWWEKLMIGIGLQDRPADARGLPR